MKFSNWVKETKINIDITPVRIPSNLSDVSAEAFVPWVTTTVAIAINHEIIGMTKANTAKHKFRSWSYMNIR